MKALFALILLVPMLASARTALNDLAWVEATQSQYSSIVEKPGVQSIGIASCDPTTKSVDTKADPFVYCIVITTTSKSAFKKLSKNFSGGASTHGVLIKVELKSEAGPQPRMSGGGQ